MLPPNSATDIVHCALPCMSGASARLTPGVGGDVVGDLLGRRDAGPAVVPAAERREEDVLGAPHHALGHAGGAAGVEDVEVVGRAGQQRVAVGDADCERVLVLDRGEPLGLTVPVPSSSCDEVLRASGSPGSTDATCGPNSASYTSATRSALSNR